MHHKNKQITNMIDIKTNLPEHAKLQTMVLCSMEDLRELLQEAILLNENNNCQTENDEPKYMTTNETAKYLNVTRSTLWRWNKDKYLCPSKVGKKNMYKTTDINKIINI